MMNERFVRVRDCWGIITPVYNNRPLPERVTLYDSEDDVFDMRPSPPYRLVRMRVTTEEVAEPIAVIDHARDGQV